MQVFLVKYIDISKFMLKKIFKIITTFLISLVCLSSFAFASNTNDLQREQKGFFKLPSDSFNKTFVRSEAENAFELVEETVQKLLVPVRFLIGFVAALLFMIPAAKLVVSRGESEEDYENFKQSLIYSLIGFSIVALSGEIGQILDLMRGGILGSKGELASRFGIFDSRVAIIITFIKYVIGAVAVIYMAKAGAHMVVAGESEEDISEDKNSIIYSSIALFALVFSNNFIKNVLYKAENPFTDPSIDLGQGVSEAVGLINLIISFVGPISILSLVAAGVLYSLSSANEELQAQANRMIKVSLAAIIIIYSAFAIVSTVISGQIN